MAPARVALPYLVVGTLWILLSDWAVVHFTSSGPPVGQMAKGLLFVLISAGLIYVLSARQLREKRITELEREQLERRLSAAARFEAMGQLSGGIAHDFNNLLAVISGNIDAYMKQDPDRGRGSSELREANDAVQRAMALTRQLLAFGRSHVVRPEGADVNAVVRGMAVLLGRLVGDTIRIRTWLDPHLPEARVDPGRLEQVVMNLAINARDAMPDGGELHLTTTRATIAAGNTGSPPSDVAPGTYVRLEVSDTGVGMDEEIQSRIFEPFFTTKGHDGGTGLGLATVHAIVVEWGGAISVHSARDEGTTFRILLPAAVGDAPLQPPAVDVPEHSDPPAPATGTVLVVDDDAAVRAIVARVLRRHGFTVREAPGGREALADLVEQRGAIDLMVTDASMPEMSGTRLIEAARALDPALGVLLISGRPGDEFDGTMPYLGKPFSAEELVRHVREILGR